MSAYPFYAILMYLSILFAPPDVNRITIKMPGGEPEMELVRNGGEWEFSGNSLAIDGGNLTTFGEEGRQTFKITDFVALPGEHDWKRQPLFTLGGGNTMEKVAMGFNIRREAPEGEGNGIYQIRYHKPLPETASITVNVLGQVAKPGVHQIPANGILWDVLAAAGQRLDGADMTRVTILRGPAGSVPNMTTLDLTANEGSKPIFEPGDTIYVSKIEDSDPDGSAKIEALAKQWLAAVDGGDYTRSWNEAAEFLQNSITVEAWTEAVTNFREPLGELKSRKLRDSQKADALPGAPDGKYVIMQFDTSFEAKAQAVETVTFMMEKTGSWKAAGYLIR